jgi:exonuclease III
MIENLTMKMMTVPGQMSGKMEEGTASGPGCAHPAVGRRQEASCETHMLNYNNCTTGEIGEHVLRSSGMCEVANLSVYVYSEDRPHVSGGRVGERRVDLGGTRKNCVELHKVGLAGERAAPAEVGDEGRYRNVGVPWNGPRAGGGRSEGGDTGRAECGCVWCVVEGGRVEERAAERGGSVCGPVRDMRGTTVSTALSVRQHEQANCGGFGACTIRKGRLCVDVGTVLNVTRVVAWREEGKEGYRSEGEGNNDIVRECGTQAADKNIRVCLRDDKGHGCEVCLCVHQRDPGGKGARREDECGGEKRQDVGVVKMGESRRRPAQVCVLVWGGEDQTPAVPSKWMETKTGHRHDHAGLWGDTHRRQAMGNEQGGHIYAGDDRHPLVSDKTEQGVHKVVGGERGVRSDYREGAREGGGVLTETIRAEMSCMCTEVKGNGTNNVCCLRSEERKGKRQIGRETGAQTGKQTSSSAGVSRRKSEIEVSVLLCAIGCVLCKWGNIRKRKVRWARVGGQNWKQSMRKGIIIVGVCVVGYVMCQNSVTRNVLEDIAVMSTLVRAELKQRSMRRKRARARQASRKSARVIWVGVIISQRQGVKARGGYGLQTQHRYLETGCWAGMTKSERQKQIKFVIMKVRKLYDPAGDGMCWWYCIAEALKGRRKNTYERIRDAIEIQRRVMDAVEKEARSGTAGMAEIIMQVSETCNCRYSAEQFWAEMAHLRMNPFMWTLKVNEWLVKRTADVLRIRICRYTVTQRGQKMSAWTLVMGQNNPGREINVIYESDNHYMLSLEMGEDRTQGGVFAGKRGYGGGGMDSMERTARMRKIIALEMGIKLSIAEEGEVRRGEREIKVNYHKIRVVRGGYTEHEEVNEWRKLEEVKQEEIQRDETEWVRTYGKEVNDGAERAGLGDGTRVEEDASEYLDKLEEEESVSDVSESDASDSNDNVRKKRRLGAEGSNDRKRRRKMREMLRESGDELSGDSSDEEIVELSDDSSDEEKVEECGKEEDEGAETEEQSEKEDEEEREGTMSEETIGGARGGEEEVLGAKTAGKMQGMSGEEIESLSKLKDIVRRAVNGQILTLSLNIRSVGKGGVKLDLIKQEILEIIGERDIVVIIAVQETWLRSSLGRKAILEERCDGVFITHRLDRARPEENQSGGVAIVVAGRGVKVKSEAADVLGVMRSIVSREMEVGGKKIVTERIAVVTVYVPTGVNKLTAASEEKFEKRLFGIIKNSEETQNRVIVTGDLNHRTNEWSVYLRACGFQMVGREGVEVIMVKAAERVKGGFCRGAKDTIPTDHAVMWATMSPAAVAEEFEIQETVSRKILEEHDAELKERVTAKLALGEPVGELMRLRNKLKRAAEAGKEITKKYRHKQGKPRKFMTKKYNRLSLKLRGIKPLRPGQTKNRIRKEMEWEKQRWKRKGDEKRVKKVADDYKNRKKAVFRSMKGLNGGRDEGPFIWKGKEYAMFKDKIVIMEKTMGKVWTMKPERKIEGLEATRWNKYLKPHQSDRLDDAENVIGRVPGDDEIKQAFEAIAYGKASHEDQVTKELIERCPPEVYRECAEYIKRVFETGEVEVEEGDTEVVRLRKKLDKAKGDVTNMRPISLIKFVTKWWQGILARRLQNRVTHLENFGFMRERGTITEIWKLKTILEYARLNRISVHLMTIDIEKAYDTVPYTLLEDVLKAYGCPANILKLIMNAQVKRTIRIRVGDGHTERITPLRGLAQGSPMSCILFVMVIEPLLMRLKAKTQGIVSCRDDSGYADDLTLLTRTPEMMKKKWKIVRSFEKWSGMKVNRDKCEYDTTEGDPKKWVNIRGIQNKRMDGAGRNIKILGVVLNLAGDNGAQLEECVNKLRTIGKLIKYKRKPPEVTRGMLNMVTCSQYNYVAQMAEMSSECRRKMVVLTNQIVRDGFGYPKGTAIPRIYTAARDGGDGITNPAELGDRSFIAEGMVALNARGKEASVADLMLKNWRKVEQINRKPMMAAAMKRKPTVRHKMDCRGVGCKCAGVETYNTFGMQMARACIRQGIEIAEYGEWNNRMGRRLEVDRREARNGEGLVKVGQLIWMVDRMDEGNGYLGRVAWIQKGSDEEGVEVSWLAMMWYPRYTVEDRKQARTIFGEVGVQRKRKKIARERKIFVSPEAICERAGLLIEGTDQLKWALKNQWDWEGEQGPVDSLKDVVGFHWDNVWWMDVSKYKVYGVNTTAQKVKVRGKRGKHKIRWDIETVEVDQIWEQEVSFGIRFARRDMEQVEETLNREGEWGGLEVWTDGSLRNRDGDRDKGKEIVGKTVKGYGARVKIGDRIAADIAVALTRGVRTILGAEMAPWLKIIRMIMLTGCEKVVFKTDSQSGIQMWSKIVRRQMSDREVTFHPDRNVILGIMDAIRRDPSLVEKVSFVKVISHTGEVDGEAADSLAVAGADREGAVEEEVSERLRFVLIKDNEVLQGPVRKMLAEEHNKGWIEKWRALPTQGEFARRWTGTRRPHGPAAEISGTKTYVRMINSGMMRQDKWSGAERIELILAGGKVDEKFRCLVCGTDFVNMDHMLACVGKGKDMAIAELKARCVGAGILERVRSAEDWHEKIGEKEGDGRRLRGNVWIHMMALSEMARRFRTQVKEGRVSDVKDLDEFEDGVVAAVKRERTRWARMSLFEENGEYVEWPKRQAPMWVKRLMIWLGIYKEVYVGVTGISWWMEAAGTREEEDRGIGSCGTGWEDSLEGGTFSCPMERGDDPYRAVEEVCKRLWSMRRRVKMARHVMLTMIDSRIERKIQGGGARILARWGKGEFEFDKADRWTNRVECERRESGDREWNTCEQEVALIIWDTESVDITWWIPDDFWYGLSAEAGVYCRRRPAIPGWWSPPEQVKQDMIKARLGPMKEKPGEEVVKGYDQKLWVELMKQEREQPCVFWGTRVAKLAGLEIGPRDEKDQDLDRWRKLNSASMKVEITLERQKVEKVKAVKLWKVPEQAERLKEYKVMTREKRKIEIGKYMKMECLIFEALKKIRVSHIRMGRVARAREGEWKLALIGLGPRPEGGDPQTKAKTRMRVGDYVVELRVKNNGRVGVFAGSDIPCGAVVMKVGGKVHEGRVAGRYVSRGRQCYIDSDPEIKPQGKGGFRIGSKGEALAALIDEAEGDQLITVRRCPGRTRYPVIKVCRPGGLKKGNEMVMCWEECRAGEAGRRHSCNASRCRIGQSKRMVEERDAVMEAVVNNVKELQAAEEQGTKEGKGKRKHDHSTTSSTSSSTSSTTTREGQLQNKPRRGRGGSAGGGKSKKRVRPKETAKNKAARRPRVVGRPVRRQTKESRIVEECPKQMSTRVHRLEDAWAKGVQKVCVESEEETETECESEEDSAADARAEPGD